MGRRSDGGESTVKVMMEKTADGATERAIKHWNIAYYLAAIHLKSQHSDWGACRHMGLGVDVEGSTEIELSEE